MCPLRAAEARTASSVEVSVHEWRDGCMQGWMDERMQRGGGRGCSPADYICVWVEYGHKAEWGR